MSKPKIAAKKPVAVELQKGETYYWCTCGRSQRQPFCDGSHRDTDFVPKEFRAKDSGTAYLCQCKHTNNPPYCDGTHAQLEESTDPPPEEPAREVGPTKEEPTLELIHDLARYGLEKTGHHGEMAAMGVPRTTLPLWDDIQILTAQLARRPLMEDSPVATKTVIGPNAKRPLVLDIPLLVSDMSFGALSQEAKIALATGAEQAGTGICSGEGGMLPEEREANSRYFYELASAKFGYRESLISEIQAFHFKGGQAAKTGTGGHLPGNKVTQKIAEVRCLEAGKPAISPPTFEDLVTPEDFKAFSDRVRERSGGIPIGMKLSANHIEEDLEFALQSGVDYVILDGRGGGTGAAPRLFRDHISVPTIPALARARRFLDERDRRDVTLVITGGLRTPTDFIKAMCLGADAVALSTAAMQAIGCVAARMCHTNLCPAGIATQDPELRKKIDIRESAARLKRFLLASTELMKVMARACGYRDIHQFNSGDVTTWKKDMADLAGIRYAGAIQSHGSGFDPSAT